MQLFHGTISTGAENIIKKGIILKKGKKKVNFGQGFYTSASYEFAKSTAINKAKKTNSYGEIYVEPVVLTFEIDTKLLHKMSILRFQNRDIKWAQFIINNRNGYGYMDEAGSHFHNIGGRFDIVKGAIADRDISVLSRTLGEMGEKVQESDIENMIYPYITCQISFHTQKALSCIKLTECDIIKPYKEKGDAANE